MSNQLDSKVLSYIAQGAICGGLPLIYLLFINPSRLKDATHPVELLMGATFLMFVGAATGFAAGVLADLTESIRSYARR